MNRVRYCYRLLLPVLALDNSVLGRLPHARAQCQGIGVVVVIVIPM